jgi:hypothetical protein
MARQAGPYRASRAHYARQSAVYRNNARQLVAEGIKAYLITSPDVSTYLRPGRKSSWGWTSAGKPLNAIFRSSQQRNQKKERKMKTQKKNGSKKQSKIKDLPAGKRAKGVTGGKWSSPTHLLTPTGNLQVKGLKNLAGVL